MRSITRAEINKEDLVCYTCRISEDLETEWKCCDEHQEGVQGGDLSDLIVHTTLASSEI